MYRNEFYNIFPKKGHKLRSSIFPYGSSLPQDAQTYSIGSIVDISRFSAFTLMSYFKRCS